MAPETIIALDAMGGDNAPAMVIRGADIAVERMPDLIFKLVGDEQLLEPLIGESKYLKSSNCSVIHTDKKVEDSEKPSLALRTGKDSSMRLSPFKVGKKLAIAGRSMPGHILNPSLDITIKAPVLPAETTP